MKSNTHQNFNLNSIMLTSWKLGLPTNILKDYLYPYLTLNEAKIISFSNDEIRRAYKALIDFDSLVSKLLTCVAKGNQDGAEELLKNNIEIANNLIITKTQVIDYSNRMFINTSAFQYALWARDRHMWEMLLTYICLKNALEQLIELEISGLEYSINNLVIKSPFYDFNPILNSMQNIMNFDFLCSTISNFSELKKVIFNIGVEQRNFPVHVVNEYFHKSRSFEPTPKFDEKLLIRRIGWKNDQFFPTSYTLERDRVMVRSSDTRSANLFTIDTQKDLDEYHIKKLKEIYVDFKALKSLNEIRTNEFVLLKSNLYNLRSAEFFNTICKFLNPLNFEENTKLDNKYLNDLLYIAAKNADRQIAKSKIDKIFTYIKHKLKTPFDFVNKLAVEGEKDILEFLKKNYGVLDLNIISGYAQGGHGSFVLEIINDASVEDHYILKKNAARGYAQGGHFDEVMKIFLNSADESSEIVNEVIFGFAKGGFIVEAFKVLALHFQENDSVSHKQLLVKYANTSHGKSLISGLVQGGYFVDSLDIYDCLVYSDFQDFSNKYAVSFGKAGHEIEEDIHIEKIVTRWAGWPLSNLHWNYLSNFYLRQGNALAAKIPGGVYQNGVNSAIARSVIDKIKLSNNIIILNFLSHFDDNINGIANNLDSPNMPYELYKKRRPSWISSAMKLNNLIYAEKLNFNQAMAWSCPEMIVWLLQCSQLIKKGKISVDIFLLITKYVFPMFYKDIIDLTNKLTFKFKTSTCKILNFEQTTLLSTCKERFFRNLKEKNQLLLDLSIETKQNKM